MLNFYSENSRSVTWENVRREINNEEEFEDLYQQLESMPQRTFLSQYIAFSTMVSEAKSDEQKCAPYKHLHHSIGFFNDIEVLERFLKSGMIVPGKYISEFNTNIMNSNEGTHISLLKFHGVDEIEYKAFICERLTLLINPMCDPKEAKYVSEDMWEYITTNHPDHKNRYSWAKNEYQIEQIPTKYIDAVGVPYEYITHYEGKDVAEEKLNKVFELIKKYKLNIPVYDNSSSGLNILQSKEANMDDDLER